MKNCVFCRIVHGQLPCSKLFEDDLTFCFLDIAPITLGHALLIPKEHHTSITTVPALFLQRMLEVAPRIAQAIVRVVDGDGFNLHLANGACAGQVVPHAHLHIIPRSPTDGFSWGWRSLQYGSDLQKEELAQKVIARLAPSSPITSTRPPHSS